MKKLASITGLPVAALLSMLALPQMSFAYSCASSNNGQFYVCNHNGTVPYWESQPEVTVEDNKADVSYFHGPFSSLSINGVSKQSTILGSASVKVVMTTADDCTTSTGVGLDSAAPALTTYTMSSTATVVFGVDYNGENTLKTAEDVCFVIPHDGMLAAAGSPIVWKLE